MSKPHPRGLSLAELLVAMALLVTVLVLGLSGLRVDAKTGRSQGLANELKGLFSRARAQAVSTGTPVGLVFPTSGGSTPVVTECAILSGPDLGRVERRLSFEGNYPDTGIFLGSWALGSGQTFSVPAGPAGAEAPRFSFATWLPPALSSHAAWVFLPSGQIVSNGQQAVGAEYPFLVATQMAVTPGSGGATLQAAGDAYTVLISERATSRLEKGVLGGQVPAGGGGPESWTLATLDSVPAPATLPVIRATEVLPAPIDAAFAAERGAECVVEQGGVVSLRVSATDDDGGPLYCRWTAADGDLSHPSEIPMLYSPEQDAWVAEWHWKPPSSAAVDDIFELDVTVRDESGDATADTGVVVNPRVLVVDRGVLAFSTSRHFSSADPEQRSYVFSSRYDGTDLRAIVASMSTAGFEGGLGPSRDGRRIAVGSDYNDRILKLISQDGAEVKTVPVGGSVFRPFFSADSNKVYLAQGEMWDPSAWTLSVVSFDSAGDPIVNDSPFPGIVSGWSPDGTQALVQTLAGDVVICDAGSGAQVSEVYSSAEPGGPAIALDWNSRGIFYGNQQTNTDAYPEEPGDFRVHQVDTAGAGTSIGSYKTCADLGGDGRYMFYVDDGIRQEDLNTRTSRLIVPSFVRPATAGFSYGVGGSNMWKATRHLSTSN